MAGLEEIKEELQETIDFINNSTKYRKWAPKYLRVFYSMDLQELKTLLAKAVAGETNSTFLYASGAEFVEKYVVLEPKGFVPFSKEQKKLLALYL